MMSLKLNLSTPRAERHNSDVLLLKPAGSAVPDNLDLRARPKTLAPRVAQFPFLARFAVVNLFGVATSARAATPTR
jgi:hypothetical protein